jgi:hypothetical protein
MKPTRPTTLALASAVALAVACSSGASGPERTLRDFYDNLNRGEYAAAMDLYEEEFREYLEDPAQSGMSFADWARTETKDGTLSDVRVITESTTEGTSEIEFELRYEDGSSRRRRVSLTEVGGVWRLGGIG